MKTSLIAHVLLAANISLAPYTAVAQTQASPKMNFFVTSVGKNGGSGNLDGLRGADAHCQSLAEHVGAGQREWRAYLSTASHGAYPGIDARDRIGDGPWYNAKGTLIARNLDELHSDRNRIDRHTAITEKGEPVIGRSHDILTGSDALGRLASVYGRPATCENWTSDGEGRAMMGHHDRFMDRGARFPRWNRSWVAAHPSRGCDAARIQQTGSAGLFYCFAQRNDAAVPELSDSSTTEPKPASFKRGLNIAHWLSHNYLPEAPYAATWFDEDDVAWIAAQGFDHLRLRIAGDRLINKNGDIDEANIAHLDRALAWARTRNLGVVFTMLSLPGYRHGVIGEPEPTDKNSPFTDDDTRIDAEYVWWQVARRYANEGNDLRFEILHRPAAPDKASMRVFNETMLKAIRLSNPNRMVYVTSRGMDIETLSEAMDGDLIAMDWNIALAFEDSGGKTFSEKADETERFAEASQRFAWGRELYLAEFMACGSEDDPEVRSYLSTVRDIATKHGWSWAVYDYQSGCAVRAKNGTGGRTPAIDALGLSSATGNAR